MLTLEEQILFLQQQRKESIQTLQNLQEHFGDRYAHIFTEKINHHIFCFDSVLESLQKLQSKNPKNYGQ